ncbi:uncharacterized protein A1O5_12181 [Cladophialophora psammophila CBS 110553]|uniref:Major facilitator superfamily (MFS) profile domain-containing protein n=1 Tax=Cladophialophora psammophila CBS 110553 TaxID=1182543 RepID=W9W2Q8_9EURO|nr:uncharacterized protein A1O5_12181 [Cladophialophora psammophila CBS 110553]EXJ59300.1 hypothetical protein A1O5_12181 [Cladophialophora psammophila CBS 110553]
MSEKVDAYPVIQEERSSGHELCTMDTNNTVSTGFEETEDENFKYGFTRSVAFVGLALGFYSDNMVASSISSVLTHINAELGPSTAYAWTITAIYTVVSITAPFVGRLGDIFGRRSILILGNVLGVLGCIVSATAKSISTLIVGAVILGLASSMDLLGWAAVGETVPKKYRPVAVGMYEVSITPSAIFGTLIGLTLQDHTALGWRNIYWICLGLHGLAIPLLAFFYHPVNQYIAETGKSKRDQMKSLDYIGTALFAIGLCLFLIGLSFGGTKYPWYSAGTIGPLIIGIVFLVFTGLYEKYTHSPYNIFPHSVMKNYRGFSIVTGVGFLLGMLYYSTLILWPIQIATFYSRNSITIGVYGMSWGWGSIIGAMVMGFIIERVNQARFLLTAVVLLMTVCIGTQAIVGIHTNVASCILVALTGMMLACAVVTTNSIIQLSVPHQYIGVAMGIVTTSRYVGGSVGSTIYQVILSNQLSANLGKNVATALAKAGVPFADIPAIAGAIALGETNSPALAGASPAALGAGVLALKLTYVHAFKIIYLTSIAFGVLGITCAAFSRNIGEFLTNKLDVKTDTSIHLGLHEVHLGGHVLNQDGEEITRTSRVTK